jgi:hypothetical protein
MRRAGIVPPDFDLKLAFPELTCAEKPSVNLTCATCATSPLMEPFGLQTGRRMLRTLTTVTFVYDPREDRIAAAINAGRPEAWSCWLTRRLALALLERASGYLSKTSDLAQQAPAEMRREFAAFEREAAMVSTAGAMTKTAPEILRSSADAAELADRLTISRHTKGGFKFELQGHSGEGAAGLLTRAEMQRMLQMLRAVVTKAGWVAPPQRPQAASPTAANAPKPVRH